MNVLVKCFIIFVVQLYSLSLIHNQAPQEIWPRKQPTDQARSLF